MTITQDPTGTLYVGGSVTLECLIRLDNTVDTSVTVSVEWSTSDGVANTSRFVVSPVTGSFPTHNAMLHLSNLMMSDSGNYTCNASASPDPPSPFIVSSEGQSELLSITIGKNCAKVLCTASSCYILGCRFYVDLYLSIFQSHSHLPLSPPSQWQSPSPPHPSTSPGPSQSGKLWTAMRYHSPTRDLAVGSTTPTPLLWMVLPGSTH